MQASSNRRTKSTAISLRQRQTPVEGKLWTRLRNRQFHGYKFRRQHAIGRFIADFVCIEKMLVVELDGAMHAVHTGYDTSRDVELQAQGFFVLRIKNSELKESYDWCLERIRVALERDLNAPPSPYPLPPVATPEGRGKTVKTNTDY